MNGKVISKMLLSIKDQVKLSISNFYYKLLPNNKFDIGYDKQNEEGWIHCPVFTGDYCGDRNRDGELNIIKVRVTDPIPMSHHYYSYLEFSPSVIDSIEILQKAKNRKDDNTDTSRQTGKLEAIKVTDLSSAKSSELLKELVKDINLGDKATSEMFTQMLKENRSHSEKIFLVEWRGLRVPQGVVLNGKTISWTQNGVVTDSKGNIVGTYERVVDEANEQKMLFFM